MARRILVDMGPYSLDLTVADDADLDGEFDATCNDTNEQLLVKGWLIDNIEEMENVRA